jgi:hypothetical protein
MPFYLLIYQLAFEDVTVTLLFVGEAKSKEEFHLLRCSSLYEVKRSLMFHPLRRISLIEH